MQTAVPSSYGKLFGAYQDAFSRDWWRVSKCFERIKVVNLGGSAIGTGLTVPKFVIFEALDQLRQIVQRPLTRSENLQDPTSNLDAFVEVHATLKAHAVNLEKIAGDLRLLASDIHGHYELTIPARQVGSSIMPGKINPVIPEFIISLAHQVYAHDMTVTSLSAQGVLDLNAYLPIIGLAMLQSIKSLIAADRTMRANLIHGLTITAETSLTNVYHSPAITTALVPYIGYHQAAALAQEMKRTGRDIFEINQASPIMDPDVLREILKPGNLLKLGYMISEVIEQQTTTPA
jgi:aspartate ammonia-lyase